MVAISISSSINTGAASLSLDAKIGTPGHERTDPSDQAVESGSTQQMNDGSPSTDRKPSGRALDGETGFDGLFLAPSPLDRFR